MKDDQYRGYDIPADTMIIPNIWLVKISVYPTIFSSHIIPYRAMTRDEHMYPEPELFNPERFMNEAGTETDSTDPKDFIFGFGRRQVMMMCPFHPPEMHYHLGCVRERVSLTQTCGWFRHA
jgi:Cytochrome P450